MCNFEGAASDKFARAPIPMQRPPCALEITRSVRDIRLLDRRNAY
jgi:hypothetical protein